MQKLLLVSVMVSTAMAGTAVAGRAKAKWCPKSMDYMASGDVDDFAKKDDVESGLRAVVGAMCDPDHFSNDKWGAIDDAYKKLSTRLGMSEDDWADVVVWATAQMHNPEVAPPDAKKPWSQYDAIDQFAGVEGNSVTASGKGGAIDAPYFVDALGANLTETGRLGWINWCLSHGNADKPLTSAICQPDIDAFDPKKVPGELKATKGHTGWDRTFIRLALDDVKTQIPKHAAKVKAMIAKDPVYGQMFEIAKKERTADKPSTDLIALEVAMEDGLVTGSRKASDGCGEKTTKAVLGSISKIPAKTFALHRKADEDEMIFFNDMTEVIASGLLSEPDPYLAMNAFAICRAMTETSDDDQVIESLARNAGDQIPGYRGPRTAAQTRIFFASLVPDDRDAKIEYPRMARLWFGGRDGGSWRGANGLVTKVATKGNTTHIEFQLTKRQVYVSFNCKSTGRIQAIRSNGEIVYEETCADSKLETIMEGPHPHDVSADQGKNVKVGMVINVIGPWVLTAWPAKSDTPVAILGQPVK